eukprot:5905987-Prymnesium_polylepis.1
MISRRCGRRRHRPSVMGGRRPATTSMRTSSRMARSSTCPRTVCLPGISLIKGWASEVTDTLWVLRQKRG